MRESGRRFAEQSRHIASLAITLAALVSAAIAVVLPLLYLTVEGCGRLAALPWLPPHGDSAVIALIGLVSAVVIFAGLRMLVRGTLEGLTESQAALIEAYARGQAAEGGMLRASARLMDAIEAIPEGFLLLDAQDRIVLSNTSYRKLYGLDAAPMTPGTRFDEFVRTTAERGVYRTGDLDTDAWVNARMAWHRAAGDKDDCFVEHLADGRWIEVRERRTQDGGIVGTRRDVTQTRHQERVEREREKLAALGQLAGGVAHEIANLLQPALILPELVRDRLAADDVESREDLEIVLINVRQAREIVRGILLYARKEEPALVQLDLAAEIGAALAFIRPLVPPGVALRVESLPGGTMAAVNKTQLTQILTNLVVNAGHAMNGHGSVTVALGTASPAVDEAQTLGIEAGKPYLTLSVTDDGCGMDASVQSHIFEPFFTTKPLGHGTGLGLSVVYGIMRSWGGAITVDSTPGRGTIFTLYIPAAGNELSAAETPQTVPA
ncbi:MAG TPA: PAS-domain containing protein [Aliidongia sp.]|nr:PAS-domain containing protein [Aliidongia sp.]